MSSEAPKRVITPRARLSYPALFEKAKPMEGSTAEPKYQCELIFEPGADLTALKAAANQAARDKWGDKPPKKLKNPFRDGDTDREDKDGYEGATFITAKSSSQPGIVVGPEREDCMDRSQVYGGCYVKCSVTAHAYDKGGNVGVGFFLNNVWKIGDGDSFGGDHIAAADEFADQDAENSGVI